jgi:hypothetical protein
MVPSLVTPSAESTDASLVAAALAAPGVDELDLEKMSLSRTASDGVAPATPLTAAAAATESLLVKKSQLNFSVQQLIRYNYSALDSEAHSHGAANGVVAVSASPYLSSIPNATSSILIDSCLKVAGASMFDHFLSVSRLSSTLNRIQTERGSGDPYLILFAHHYYSQYTVSAHRTYILDMILALEYSLRVYSRYNYQFKLWLIRLYNHPEIGAYTRSAIIYRSLDIKQVQHEITSHLILEDSIRYGSILDAIGICNRIINWHANADREHYQTTQLAYERGNYTKVIEFAEFKERRKRSAQLYQARIIKAYANVLLGAGETTIHTTEGATISQLDLVIVHNKLAR